MDKDRISMIPPESKIRKAETCRKCHAAVVDGAKYCHNCGASLTATQNTKSRGNGTGSVYKRGKSWVCVKTVGYYTDEDGKLHRQIRSKGGFKTKKEAVNYLPKLKENPKVQTKTLMDIWDLWEPTHKTSEVTMKQYRSTFNQFKSLWNTDINRITIDDLQGCLDRCGSGKRTQSNMKMVAGLLYKHAVPRGYAKINMAQYLKVGGEKGEERKALPMDVLDVLWENVGKVFGADYILCQCYLGFRPAELLALDVESYNPEERAFVGGMKTEAGRDRTVTVSPRIQHLVDAAIDGRETGPVFRSKTGKRMGTETYRNLFSSVLEQCGIDNPKEGKGKAARRRYTPHSCRHTFANLIKSIDGADKDKLELIGHTSSEMLRYYQSVNVEDLRKITDQMK